MDLFDVYPLYEITPVWGSGCELQDTAGHRYLDLYGGHAVISVGHSHPHYVERLGNQLEKLGFYSNSVRNPLQEQLALKMGEMTGYDQYRLFLVNSGAEAIENALKLASFHTGRSQVIAFQGGFHGRTAGALAVTDNDKISAPINNRDHVFKLPLNDSLALENMLKEKDVAAVLIEGIQGISGIQIPEPEFLERLRDLCHHYGALLILDEIQSGCGRTGKFFAHQHAGIQPDIITMAKGMGNGFPVGGLLIHPELKAIHGQLGTTFGGNHLACCAALAVLEIMETEDLLANARSVGGYLMGELGKIRECKEVRGMGLMIGLEMGFPIRDLRQHLLFQERMFVGSSSDPHVLRLLPPLNLSRPQAEVFIDSLTRSLKLINQQV